VSGTSLISPFVGNFGVSAYLPGLALPIAVSITALTLLFVLRADENRSLVWALAAAILASPYGGPYLTLPLLLALPLIRPWARVYALVLLQPLTAISAALAGVVGVLTGPPATMDSAHTPLGSVRRLAEGNGSGAEPAKSDAIALSPGG
jgi:hypothetical protein